MFFSPTQDAARGAKFLDRKFPGWHERIDLVALDLGNLDTCVLAQATGEYFGLAAFNNRLSEFQTKRLGFYNSKPGRYPALTDAWRQLILARRVATA